MVTIETLMSNSETTTTRSRIRIACEELEAALANFENVDDARERAKQERLRELKARLSEIKVQLEELS